MTQTQTQTQAERREAASGLGYALAAYGTWGILPVFWKLLTHVPASELLVNRVVWGVIAFGLLVWLRGRSGDFWRAFRNRRALAILALSGALLAGNWLTFLYAMAADRVLHVSLGYFINPLVSMVLGVVLLGERLGRWQLLAVTLAIFGVGLYATQADGLPWISLVLAISFGLYGFLRKTVAIDALPGSTLEMLLLVVPALGYGVFLEVQGVGHFGHADVTTHLLLLCTGAITAVPLLWFANAVRRLSLTTIGFLQYLAPSGHFLLAVFVYDEPFGTIHLVSFVAIWVGLLVFTVDSGRRVLARPRDGQP